MGSLKPKSPDQGCSIAEALIVAEHLERQQEIKATSKPFAESFLDRTWSGKVTKQTRDHRTSEEKRDRGKEKGRKGKLINRPHWGRVCGSDVTGGSNLSDVL